MQTNNALLGIKKYSKRELRWLYDYLNTRNVSQDSNQNHNPTANQGAFTLDSLTQGFLGKDPDSIISFIKKFPKPEEIASNISIEKENALISMEYFNWLKDSDEKLLLWMMEKTPYLPKMQASSQYKKQQIIPPNINAYMALPPEIEMPVITFLSNKDKRKQIILIIDMWDSHINDKKIFLNKMRIEWEQTQTPEPLIRWIDPKNKTQIEWVISYLNKKDIPIHIHTRISPKEGYKKILDAMDGMRNMHIAEKQIFIERMKRTWSQKKYRDSENAKRQVSFAMNDNIRSKLNVIAQKNDEKLYETLERLIKAEYKSISKN